MVQPKSPLKTLILILGLVLFIVVIVFGYMWIKNPDNINIPDTPPNNSTNSSINTTTIINQNITQYITNIDESGQANAWSFAIIVGIVIIIGLVITVLGIAFFKFLGKSNLISAKKKKECEVKAIEQLKEKGYDIEFTESKQSYPFYGIDNEKNPAWAFVFFKSHVNPISDVNTVSKFDLISCTINAKTLEISNETHGKDLDDIKQDLNEQRFGKQGVPNFPGKTEKPPAFEDLFERTKPTISFDLNKDEEDEQ